MIVDLFAGPGGWDVGAALAGLEQPFGIEIDEHAERRPRHRGGRATGSRQGSPGECRARAASHSRSATPLAAAILGALTS